MAQQQKHLENGTSFSPSPLEILFDSGQSLSGCYNKKMSLATGTSILPCWKRQRVLGFKSVFTSHGQLHGLQRTYAYVNIKGARSRYFR